MAQRKYMRNANGYGSVHKLSGNRRKPWRVRVTKGWTEDGKQLFDNVGYCETRPEAMQLLAKYNDDPWDTSSTNVTFAKMFELWFEVEEKKMRPASRSSYLNAYRRTESIQKMIFKNIRIQHLQKIINEMEVGYIMKKNVKTLYNKMYAFAIKNDFTSKNYATFVEVPKDKEPIKPHVPFTDDEIKSIWSKQGEHFDIAKILIFSGMRINELLTMETANIHLDEGYMIGGLKTKAGIDRLIPISRHIKPIIQKWFDPDKKYLIQKRGMSYTSVGRFWLENISGHTTHDARHTFISLINRAEVNDVSIERIVGHASQGVTKIVYTHKSSGDLIQAMTRFDDYVEKALCI